MASLQIGIDARAMDGAIGGAQQGVIGLAKTLCDMPSDDLSYFFFVYERHENWLIPFVTSGTQLIRLPAPNVSSNSMPISKKFRQTIVLGIGKYGVRIPAQDNEITNYEFDAIHFPLQTAFWTTTPNLFHPHDLQHRHLPQFFTRRERTIRDVAYRHFCEQASQIIIPTQWGKQDLMAQYDIPADKITVIPQPSNLDYYPYVSEDDCQRIKASLSLPDKFLFYPARMWRHKNHLRLLSAIALLKTEYQLDVPLVLSGGQANHTQQILAMIEALNLSEQIQWVGYVEPSVLKCLYQLSHTVILTSLFEGWGFPTIEAMSMNKPIICSDLPPLRDVCESAALYVNPYEVESIASAIFQLYTNDKTYHDYVQRGQVQATKYAWSTVGQQIQGLYRRIANGN